MPSLAARLRYETLAVPSVNSEDRARISEYLQWKKKQVFPGGWTAVLVSLDNVGVWNLRAERLDDWYRGQEVYVKVADPLGYNITEMVVPDNALYCGLLKERQKYVSSQLMQ